MAENYPPDSDRLLDDMLKQDASAPRGMFERCESRLFERISSHSGAEPWELYLKKDVPPALLDETEKKLFNRIKPKPAVLFPSLFSTTAFSLVRMYNPPAEATSKPKTAATTTARREEAKDQD
jgi:hypothetical protein